MRPRGRQWPAARELFDDGDADAATALASLRDIARANRFLGGAGAALDRLSEVFRATPPGTTLTLLDVGTGTGDIPRAALERAAAAGLVLRTVGVERHAAAARAAAAGGALAAIRGDAVVLPLRPRSVDVVLCSQLLHHYHGAAVTAIVAELERVARRAVVIADIRPSRLAAAGLWLVSFPLRFHPVSRRDGVTSVRRGFTPSELRRACAAAGVDADVRTHPGFRVTAAWRPGGTTGR